MSDSMWGAAFRRVRQQRLTMAAVGVLTMKGLVERFDDPLLYTDEEMIDALAKIFEAAATP